MIARFFRTLVFLLSGSGTWIDGAEWTDDDKAALGTFLNSETGAELSARLRNASLSLNANAVASGGVRACGRAYGYMLAISDIQTLSARGSLGDAPTTEDATGDTGGGGLEHLNP